MSDYDNLLAATRKAAKSYPEPAPAAADIAARGPDSYRIDRAQETELKRVRKERTR